MKLWSLSTVLYWLGAWREQDKINTFWEIGKREAEDRRAELRNKDRELEELEERHQVEIKARAPAHWACPICGSESCCKLRRWKTNSSSTSYAQAQAHKCCASE